MKVVVIGGGVVGVACAYFLAGDGHEVVLLERNEEAATETSYGNAGLYTPGDSYAWASPEALVMALKSLYRRDLGIRFRLRLDPALWDWSWRFLLQCTRRRARANTGLKLRLALYSRACLQRVVDDTGIDFDGRSRGVVYAFRDERSLAQGWRHMELLRDQGLPLELVDRAGLRSLDPGLDAACEVLVGAVYSPLDQTGDSCKFARRLATWCADRYGIRLAWGTTVTGLRVDGDRVAGVDTDRGPVDADACVLAAGTESPRLAATAGLRLPIYPVKGYSVTVPVADPQVVPGVGLVDEDRLVAISRLGERLRVAAIAEFAGHDRSHRPRDFDTIFATARELFPGGGDWERAEFWAGLRPMTPSSVPILGRARYRNLFLNVGHGHVGWTMSCGSGRFVADILAGRDPEIDPRGLVYTG